MWEILDLGSYGKLFHKWYDYKTSIMNKFHGKKILLRWIDKGIYIVILRLEILTLIPHINF